MPPIVIIDGNNLLHAARQLGPIRPPSRETLVKLIERWAIKSRQSVFLVFDGPRPSGPFAAQMDSPHIEVSFSGPLPADDIIVDLLGRVGPPDQVAVVSDDTAIRHEAQARRCKTITNAQWIEWIFARQKTPAKDVPEAQETPSTREEGMPKEDWLRVFDDGEPDEPFEGFGAMDH